MPGSDSNEVLICKDVATALSKNDLNAHAPGRRTRILRHLAHCDYCVTFAEQLDSLRNAAAAMAASFDAEVPDLEVKVLQRMGKII